MKYQTCWLCLHEWSARPGTPPSRTTQGGQGRARVGGLSLEGVLLQELEGDKSRTAEGTLQLADPLVLFAVWKKRSALERMYGCKVGCVGGQKSSPLEISVTISFCVVQLN